MWAVGVRARAWQCACSVLTPPSGYGAVGASEGKGRKHSAQRSAHLRWPQPLAVGLVAHDGLAASGGRRLVHADDAQPQRARRRLSILEQVADALRPRGVGRHRAGPHLDIDDARPAHAVRQVLHHHVRPAGEHARAVVRGAPLQQRVSTLGERLVKGILASPVAVPRGLGDEAGCGHHERTALLRQLLVAAHLVLEWQHLRANAAIFTASLRKFARAGG